MPRKDPMTGVMVMTTSEFWNSEAKHDGSEKTGAELETDMYHEMDKEARKEENDIRGNPSSILEDFQRVAHIIQDGTAPYYYPDMNDLNCLNGNIPTPMIIKEIIFVKVSFGIRDHHRKIIAYVIIQNGETKRMTLTQNHYGGDYYTPPEDDDNLEWEE